MKRSCVADGAIRQERRVALPHMLAVMRVDYACFIAHDAVTLSAAPCASATSLYFASLPMPLFCRRCRHVTAAMPRHAVTLSADTI